MKLSTRIRYTAGAAALSLTILFSGALVTAPSTYAAGNIVSGGKALVANTDGDNIRVRKGAGSDYDQIAEAHEGETVSILDGPAKDGSGYAWYKVQAPGGSGWIRSDFLSAKGSSATGGSADSAQAASPRLKDYAKVANTDGDRLNLRTDPTRNGTIITTLAPAALVVVKTGPLTDKAGVVWYQVSVDGNTGWAMAQYLTQSTAPAKAAPQAEAAIQKVVKPVAPAAPAAPALPATKAAPAAPVVTQADSRSGQSRGAEPPALSSMGQSIVSVALRYVGYRYRYGGTSPSGFDCSGFVYYVVNKAGRSISRDMYSQLASGTRIGTSNLQPGDLLFFSGTYKRGLSHAGIYIGNGKFVHAENESTGVAVSQLWSAYWASHYTAAVRVR